MKVQWQVTGMSQDRISVAVSHFFARRRHAAAWYWP